MCDLQCQHHADYVLQVERVVAQMVQGSEKISYIDLYERFIFFCRELNVHQNPKPIIV